MSSRNPEASDARDDAYASRRAVVDARHARWRRLVADGATWERIALEVFGIAAATAPPPNLGRVRNRIVNAMHLHADRHRDADAQRRASELFVELDRIVGLLARLPQSASPAPAPAPRPTPQPTPQPKRERASGPEGGSTSGGGRGKQPRYAAAAAAEEASRRRPPAPPRSPTPPRPEWREASIPGARGHVVTFAGWDAAYVPVEARAGCPHRTYAAVRLETLEELRHPPRVDAIGRPTSMGRAPTGDFAVAFRDECGAHHVAHVPAIPAPFGRTTAVPDADAADCAVSAARAIAVVRPTGEMHVASHHALQPRRCAWISERTNPLGAVVQEYGCAVPGGAVWTHEGGALAFLSESSTETCIAAVPMDRLVALDLAGRPDVVANATLTPLARVGAGVRGAVRVACGIEGGWILRVQGPRGPPRLFVHRAAGASAPLRNPHGAWEGDAPHLEHAGAGLFFGGFEADGRARLWELRSTPSLRIERVGRALPPPPIPRTDATRAHVAGGRLYLIDAGRDRVRVASLPLEHVA